MDANPEQAERRKQAGAKKQLWTVEIIYNLDSESCRVLKRNLYDNEVQVLRENMFRYGFPVPVEPGHWRIIPPMDIARVDLVRQTGFFEG